MIRPPSITRRLAYTLIELLVVIAIIAILVSLTTAAVMVFFKKGPEVVNKVENIDQLSIAMTNFKYKYGFYPPSRIRLCRYRNGYGATQYDIESLSYINAMWSDIEWAPGGIPGVNWDGGLNIPNPLAGTTFTQINCWDLEGDQCLVFFLGGIPGPDGPMGFSTSKTYPTQLGGERVSFFNFKSDQLTRRLIDKNAYYNLAFPYASYSPATNDPAGTPYVDFPGTANTAYFPFSSYNDVYGKPYFYFSSGKSANGYQSSHASSSLNISPYYESNVKYVNPDSFQIISAGVDGDFGGGGQWSNAGAEDAFGGTKDNQANFHRFKLSVSGS